MATTSSGLALQAIDAGLSITDLAYQALRQAITAMNIYDSAEDLRLDERRLAEDLGVSRTPIREAIVRLELEGLVRTVPRRGTFVVRKSKKEVLEIITVWAALESMAARLITLQARDEEIASLRTIFATFQNGRLEAHLDEYSEANIQFHQRIIEMSGCALLRKTADTLLIHMGAIRRRTISDEARVTRSIIDHMHIIEALEQRETERAERLVRQHALDLAAHVAANVRYLD
jgi:DNA-binding GntR family transcriptional regulator